MHFSKEKQMSQHFINYMDLNTDLKFFSLALNSKIANTFNQITDCLKKNCFINVKKKTNKEAYRKKKLKFQRKQQI